MNILFVFEYRNNAGNTHAITNYIEVGAELGHRIAFYGSPQPQVVAGHYLAREQQRARFSTDVAAFDRVIYLFESKLQHMKPLQDLTVLGTIPREHRYIVDADGKYNPVTVIEGYDRNYMSEAERTEWLAYYDALSDNIIKPTIASSGDAKITTLPFFGFNPALVMDPAAAPEKRYDILHVGHNWWRWKEVSEQLLPAFEAIRDEVGEIAFLGMWWDKTPEWAERMNLGPALRIDSERFARLRIRVEPPVQYSDVIRTMSMGRINIFTQRPFLAHVKHLTLRYFEEFCADTIPLLMLESDLAEAVYGPAGRELTLPGRVAEKIVDALRRPDHYRQVVEDARRHLLAFHSYRSRVDELVAALAR